MIVQNNVNLTQNYLVDAGRPCRFQKKFPGHFQDKMKKLQDKTTKTSPA